MASVSDVELGSQNGVKHASSFAALRLDTGNGNGIRITVENLTYRVPSFVDKKQDAELLSNISGVFNPNEMVALLGPSGSGKTTFLDVLAGRKAIGTTTGEMLFGGKRATSQFLRRYTGYVEQFDTLISVLTAREMLLYTAELKRPMAEPLAQKELAVDTLLKDLGLWEAKDVVVGSAMVKGLSGGQAKRLNIAIALITDPSVLFLDEPTSGLDSFTANEVMSVVKKLNTRDTTILATIHSPTAYAFSLFDRAMILCSGKLVRLYKYFTKSRLPVFPYRTDTFVLQSQVFFGKSDKTLLTYANNSLRNAVGSPLAEKTQGHSDIEWLIDVFTSADRAGKAQVFAEAFAGSDLKVACDDEMKQAKRATKSSGTGNQSENNDTASSAAQQKLDATSGTTVPGWFAFYVMVKYRTKKNYSDGEYLGPRLGTALGVSQIPPPC
jgi:ABC-type multidrug transport system ATPase subunit